MSLTKKQLIGLVVGAVCTTPVFSSGYHFGTQSVSSQSTANASSAEAADAATIFYNPAGLSKLSGSNFSVNANFVAPKVKYSQAKANYFIGQPKGITGKQGGTITKDVVVAPHLYASHQLNDQLTLGLGVYIPFASGTDYQRDSVLRYNVNKMKLTSIDINPMLSYKINADHSVAAGLFGQYSSAELRQYANFAPLVAKVLSKKQGKPVAVPNGFADGVADVEGTDWGFGFNLGYLWDVNDRVRLGASYRSKVEHTLKGNAKWQSENPTVNAIVPAVGYVPKESANVKIITPESLSLHGMVKLNDRWTTFGDVTWTRHSRFNNLDINYGNPKVVLPVADGKQLSATTSLKPNWRDTYKVGIGAAYQYSDPLQLRFGIAYDQSPVRSADYRLTTLPDNNRIWFSLGAKYDINENSSLNFGYSYIHIKDTKANVNGWCGSLNRLAKSCVSSRTDGSADYKSHAHIVGVQYNYRF